MNVLLAIDDSSCSEAAVQTVLSQFRPVDTVIRVIHVVEWTRDLHSPVMFAEGPSAGACVLDAHAEVRRRARALVAHAADRLQAAGFNATPYAIEGAIETTILEIAAAWPADTIVVGSHGRMGLDRLLLGSVSEDVVRRAACSVHVIREKTGTLTPKVSARV